MFQHISKKQSTASVAIALSWGLLTLGSAQGVTFRPPKDGAPKDASSASSRGSELCQTANTSPTHKSMMTAITPQGGYGQTLASHPTILIYVPASGAKQALFSLKVLDPSLKTSNAYTTHYEQMVSLPDKPGVIAVQLPSEAPALKVGEVYQWYFSLECENSWRPRYPLQGQIERVDVPLTLPPTSIPIEQASIYGKAGIWYDAAAIVHQLHNAQPKDIHLQQQWQKLLGSVGLTGLIETQAALSIGEAHPQDSDHSETIAP